MLLRHLTILGILTLSLSAFASSYVQSNGAAVTSSGTVTLALGSNTTAGDFLFLAEGCYNVAPPTAVTDGQSNVWLPVYFVNTGNAQLQTLAAIAGSSAAETVTTSGFDASNCAWALLEYSAVNLSSLLGFGSGSSSITISSSTGYVTAVSGLAISVVFDEHSAHSWTNSGVTIRQSVQQTVGSETLGVGDANISSATFASPYTTTWSGGSGGTIAGQIQYISTGGGGGSSGSNAAFAQ